MLRKGLSINDEDAKGSHLLTNDKDLLINGTELVSMRMKNV